MATPSLPAVLLTYDFGDCAEAAVVRALAGESALRGTLPVALSETWPVGFGLTAPARRHAGALTPDLGVGLKGDDGRAQQLGEELARPARFERATSWFVARRSIQLS